MGGIGSDLADLNVPVVWMPLKHSVSSSETLPVARSRPLSTYTGEGGMIVLNNHETTRKQKLTRWFGIDRRKKERNDWQSIKNGKWVLILKSLATKLAHERYSAGMGIGWP